MTTFRMLDSFNDEIIVEDDGGGGTVYIRFERKDTHECVPMRIPNRDAIRLGEAIIEAAGGPAARGSDEDELAREIRDRCIAWLDSRAGA